MAANPHARELPAFKVVGPEEGGVKLMVDREHAEMVIHTPNEKINKLNRAAFEDIEHHIATLKAKGSEIKTLLIWSSKPDMFLAGADIEEIEALKDRQKALDLVQHVQGIFQKLSELPQIKMVAIDGPCMGGGLELALACDYRLASDAPSVRLALPEVQLGVLPGAGGTQRLPKVVDLVQAITMMTTGAPVDAKKALKIGLVSDVLPRERLLDHARKILREGVPHTYQPKETLMGWLMSSTPFKKYIFSKSKKSVLDKTKGHYPAPLKIVEVLEKTISLPVTEGLRVEAEAFAELCISPVAKNLIKLFFNMEALKKERGVGAMEAASFKPQSIKHMSVVGAGVMGGGISAVAAAKGVTVRLKDISHASIQTALQTAFGLFNKDLKRKKIDAAEWRKRSHRVMPTLRWDGFHSLPIVVEAVVENMDIKKRVIEDLEKVLPETAIIASNTSSLSISEMAKVSKRPERVVGMHFFNPVPKMPLVEVVRGDKTSAETIVQTVAFGKQLGKTVIVVKDRPGFLINRILMPFLLEAGHLKEEGYSVSQIDEAALKFGMPMGPFRLLDEIGLDTADKVAAVIAGAFPHMKVLPMIKEMVGQGYLGAKNKRGFYFYDDKGKSQGLRPELQSSPKDPGEATDVILGDRLILPMVTEAVLALDEGIVATVKELDLGLIFGIGFPPFRGGLLKWVSEEGEEKILDRLNQIHNHTRGRIIVPPGLKSRVDSRQKFYNPMAV